MSDKIASSVGEILIEEFMKPYGLTAYRVAQDIHVPISRIDAIVHDKRRISIDTAMRLSRYFGKSEKFFIDIQNDIDIRNEKVNKKNELEKIKRFKAINNKMINY